MRSRSENEVRITTCGLGARPAMRRVASIPSMSGIERSISTTSGRVGDDVDGLRAAGGRADDLDVVGAGEQLREPGAHERVVVDDRGRGSSAGHLQPHAWCPRPGAARTLEAGRRRRGRGRRACAGRSARSARVRRRSRVEAAAVVARRRARRRRRRAHGDTCTAWRRRGRRRCAAPPGRRGRAALAVLAAASRSGRARRARRRMPRAA